MNAMSSSSLTSNSTPSSFPTSLSSHQQESVGTPSRIAASPSNFSLQYVGAGAPSVPALHREWAQLPSISSGSRGHTNLDIPIEIRKTSPVFAVDISGSTRGRCLDQEKAVVAYMTTRFESATLVSQSHVLPWDGQSYGSMSTVQFRGLEAGAGTDPSVVLENSLSRCHLQRARVWFLMTDGYIEEPLVNKFANAIPNHGLHGTASVIILFGY